MKFSLKRLNDILHRFFTRLHASFTRLHVFFTKRGRMMRLIFAILTAALLCIILSGLMLTQLTSDYQPSGTNGATDPNQVNPNYQESKPISNVGSLKTIGIGAYWDENLTDTVNLINWGVLEPGAQNNVLVYFHNDGNFAVTLSKSTSNWNPSVASNYLTLSWNYNGQAIEAGENLQVTLTLSVSANVIGITDFGFDIIVVGTG